jgi:hypothetical protein
MWRIPSMSRWAAVSASIRAVIRIHELGGRVASAAASSLRPDDAAAPAWLKIRERVEDGDLVIEIVVDEVSHVRLGSLRNTVDEILSVLYALLRSIEETAKALKEGGAGATSSQGRNGA